MKFLTDSDFWYGLVVADDAHHEKCVRMLEKAQKKGAELLCLKLVIFETVTVLSKKIDQKRSLLFLKKFNNLTITKIDMNEELENLSWKVFEKQTKKGTSFIDCANLAILEKYKLDGILSFDEFYPKDKFAYPRGVKITS